MSPRVPRRPKPSGALEDPLPQQRRAHEVSDALQLIRPNELSALLQISLPTLWRWRRECEDFPKPYALGGRTVAWRRSEIERWLERRPRR